MQINYFDYNYPFLEKMTDKKEASIYVFSNYKSKIKAEKKQKDDFLNKNNLFLNLSEFKEKVAVTQDIILREEKLTSIFYKLLTNNEKDILKINDYFDVIEISSKFYNFFSEIEAYYPDKSLNSLRNLLFEKINLKEWQKEKFDIFFNIKKRYNTYMKEKGFIDQNSAFIKENFDDQYFRDYSTIIFVNKLNFNPKEKQLINYLEEKGYSLELNLQLKEEDFSEEELKLKDITLPENLQTDVKLYSVKEELLQLINSIVKFNKVEYEQKIDILDCNFEEQNYNKYLNENLIEVDKNNSFIETEIFRYLNYLKNILSTVDRRKGFLKLEIGEVLKAINNDFFRDYYEISKSDKSRLIDIKNNDYVYLTENLLENKDLITFQNIFNDIKNLENISSLDKFIDFLNDIDLSKLNDELFENNYEIFYSSLHEIKAISKMKIIDDWKNHFNNLAIGFLKFFLNYFRYKEVKKINIKNNKALFKLSSFESAAELKRDHLSIINASSDNLSKKEYNFILSEKQREVLGLNQSEDKNIIEKYYFMRHILSSDQAYIFSIKNIEENISESAYMEELSLKYNLEIEEPYFSNKDFNKIIREIFNSNQKSIHEFSEKEFPVDFKNEKLTMEKNDFTEFSSFSYYRFKRMKDCQYRYFLEHIINLEKIDLKIDKQLSVMVFGSMVHEIFARILENVNLNFELNNKTIDEITDEVLKKYNLKINNYFERYYNNVLFEKVKESAIFFLKEVQKKTKKEIQEIFIEISNKDWRKKSNFKQKSNIIYENDFSKFYLNGRVDLLLKIKDKNIIIDFKTGGSNTEQLDFYELMLFPEESQNQVEKMIYNVIDEKFNNSFKNKNEFAVDVKKELDHFMKDNNYSRIYKSRCNNCPYYDICRVVLK